MLRAPREGCIRSGLILIQRRRHGRDSRRVIPRHLSCLSAPRERQYENERPRTPATTHVYAAQEPQRGIRAAHTASTITVYQAYSQVIGLPSISEGRFPAALRRGRMTWIVKQRSQPLPGCGQSPPEAALLHVDAVSWQTCAGLCVRAGGRRSDHPRRPFR